MFITSVRDSMHVRQDNPFKWGLKTTKQENYVVSNPPSVLTSSVTSLGPRSSATSATSMARYSLDGAAGRRNACWERVSVVAGGVTGGISVRTGWRGRASRGPCRGAGFGLLPRCRKRKLAGRRSLGHPGTRSRLSVGSRGTVPAER
jgi:hypothetical protein